MDRKVAHSRKQPDSQILNARSGRSTTQNVRRKTSKPPVNIGGVGFAKKRGKLIIVKVRIRIWGTGGHSVGCDAVPGTFTPLNAGPDPQSAIP